MIKKTRIRFILIGMTATLIVTVLLIASINLVQAIQTNRNLDQVLLEMSRTKETLMQQGDGKENFLNQENRTDTFGTDQEQMEKNRTDTFGTDQGQIEENRGQDFEQTGGFKTGKKGPRGSALNQYAGRYFSAEITTEGQIRTDRFYQELVTEEEILNLANTVVQEGISTGYIDGYRYMVQTGTFGTRIGFLDCTTELRSQSRLLMISFFVGLAGLAISFALIFLASGRIVEPLRESMEKQKQFITDAGHELKTPLSVIGTNMDILSMDLGENEWVDGTRKQVRALRDLVNDLITLSKMEESAAPVEMERFNLSNAAAESADLFTGAAKMAGRKIEQQIEENLYVQGNEASVRQLFVIFCDNAVKYSEGEDPVYVRLFREGRKVAFETANHWDRTNAPSDLNCFFDRFYRSDSSRNRSSGKSGYGLGLSIARAITEKNRIQLSVYEDPEQRLVMRAVFPHSSCLESS